MGKGRGRGQKAPKGLPRRAASDHPSHKRRERSKAKGKQRKLRNSAAQHSRELINKDLRAQGLPTKWDVVKAARRERREAA